MVPQDTQPKRVGISDGGRNEVAARIVAKVSAERQKLLELSLRNPLLNYPIEQRRTSFVRIIDELPDQLWRRISNSASGMRIVGLPIVESSNPPDEQTPEFKTELAEARRTDKAYVEAMSLPVPIDQIETARPDEAIELELRDRVRAQLGMRPIDREKPPSLRELAAMIGVTPGYDLPHPSPDETPERHADTKIQTYLREDALEKLLKKLAGDIRLRREEAGLETGYAMFGFLQWYDPTSPEKPRYAPLLMLPVELERREYHGAKRYFVKARDSDEPGVNKSLIERLQNDLGLRLPEFESADDDGEGEGADTPESYFEKVEELLTNNADRLPRWRLRRFVTIGSVQFGRLVMYDDLDAAGWSSALGAHPLLAPMLLDQSGGVGSFAEEYDHVDEPAPDRPEALMLRDADSSQHSAILDALKGRSFALEGPPGTGKSQTIANLISAAIARGQTVLFLAEKMAALDVVHQRLRQVGLGEFCLQLHSTKARKKDLYQSIKDRLDLDPPAIDTHGEKVRRELKDRRARLNAYAAVMGAPVGRTGATVHQALWREISAREQLESVLGVDGLPRELGLEGAETLDPEAYDRSEQAIQSLARHFMETLEESDPQLGHPCQGLMIKAPAPFAANDLDQAMKSVVTALKQLAEIVAPLILTPSQTLDTLRKVAEIARDVPDRIEAVEATMLAGLREDDGQSAISFLDAVDAFQNRAEPDPVADDEAALGGDPTLIDDLVKAAITRLPEDATLTTLTEEIDGLGDDRTSRESDYRTLQRATGIFDLDGVSRRADAMVLLDAVDLALALEETIDPDLPQLDGIDRAALVELLGETREIQSLRADLESSVNLSEVEAHAGELEHAAVHVETSWLGRIASKDARAADAIFKSCMLDSRSTSRSFAAKVLRRAARYVDRKRAFLARHDLFELAGRQPSSVDEAAACLESRRAIESFRMDVDRVLGRQSPSAMKIGEKLKRFGETDRSRLIALIDKSGAARLRETFQEYGPRDWLATFQDWMERVDKTIDEFALLRERAEHVGLRQDLRLRDLGRFAEDRRDYLAESHRLDTAVLHPALTAYLDGAQTDVDRLRPIVELYRQLSQLPLTDTARRGLEERVEYAATRASLASLLSSVETVVSSLEELAPTATIDAADFVHAPSVDDVHLGVLIERCAHAVASPEAISTWAKYSAARREAEEAGLTRLIPLLEHLGRQGKLSEAIASKLFEYAYANRLARLAYEEHPLLAHFRSQDHATAQAQFKVLDRELLEANRAKVLQYLYDLGRSAPEGRAGQRRRDDTELTMLQHEANKQRAHAPIRTAFRQAGAAIKALTPCILMSPMTVAQFLPKTPGLFDLLVIDEASQMRTEDALGAVLRAKQIVVVGDPKQMPPSNLFKETTDDDEDEIEGVKAESVLDLALDAFRPARRLRWHYRSKHQSLIAFSNAKFYGNDLLVAPSAVADRNELGVSCHFVEDAVYKSRLNPREAEVAIELFRKHVHQYPEESAGLVAMNRPQADFLEELLDLLCSEDENVAAFCSAWSEKLEPVFVKNLENVQGDERDAIFLSTVYGKNEDGVVHNRFNSVGGEVGWRRFNVLVSRAKRRLYLVTSLKSGDVRINDTTHRGIRALRDYLEFARDGAMPAEGDASGRSPDSHFEELVLAELRNAGYAVDPQVGASGFFIDIGVRHPERPGRYILGVECDGAAYHSAKSARDRDRLRQEILEANDWKIYRIWSTDWFDNPKRELKRLTRHIEKLRRAA